MFLLTEVHDEKTVAKIAAKINQTLQAPCKVSVHGVDLDASVGASVGIAIFPKNGTTADILVKSADAAMYHAKQGRPGYSFAP